MLGYVIAGSIVLCWNLLQDCHIIFPVAENDIFWFLFKLHPLLVAVIVWLLGFGSLVLVAIKTKSLKESIVKNPGVMIGDFFLLPSVGFLIAYTYQSVQASTDLLSSPYWNLILIIALILVLISAIRFNHKSLWWLPHNFFYFLMSYVVLTFLLKGFFYLIAEGDSSRLVTYAAVLVLVALHQLLGLLFLKRFPSVK